MNYNNYMNATTLNKKISYVDLEGNQPESPVLLKR